MRKLKIILATVMAIVCGQLTGGTARAQQSEIIDSRIASLKVTVDDNWQSLPVMSLGSSSRINIDFDDMTHEYTRYTYKIEHCEADWTVSEYLFESDYMSGFTEGNIIEDSEESFNTNTLYTHYSLQIPNSDCRLTMSGNYRLTVMDEEDDDRPVLTACFMVSEQCVPLSISILTDTDRDIRNRHQQVDLELKYNGLRVVDPETQIKTVVMQNRRWDNCRVNIQPQYKMYDGLRWHHCRDYIFDAGNEYRKYEILDVDHTTMGLEHLTWDGESYHAYPYVDEPRRNYIYDEDADGAFLIRNSDNEDCDITCDYVWVHYTLKCPAVLEGRIYVNGDFTYGRFTPQYEMTYDFAKEQYEGAVLQKQGYYNYQYLMVDRSGVVSTPPFEGNFYQTENKYQVLVYYREQGGRADRLVGYGEGTKN